jgi:uncharacterized phage-associated protein
MPSARANVDKLIQAFAVLTRDTRSKCANYMRAIKLLYIADRESLKETGRTITGDHVIAMPRGPVLEMLYDLVRSQDFHAARWSEFFERSAYHIIMNKDPGVGELSKYEIGKIQEIARRYAEYDEWEMVNETHKLPEWQRNNPGSSSKPIPLEHILEAVGRQEDMASILQDEKDRLAFASIFGG